MKNTPTLKKRGFTLLEMTIALVIISIMTVGVFMGSGLIKPSKLSLAQSLTKHSPISNMDGLVAWYETSSSFSLDNQTRSDGVAIDHWYDINPRSLNSKNNTLLANLGVVSYVENGINGMPSLKFSGQDDLATNLTLNKFHQSPSLENTIFIVFQQEAKTIVSPDFYYRILLDNSTDNGDFKIGYNNANSGSHLFSINNGSGEVFSEFLSDDIHNGSAHIAAINYSAKYSRLYLNDANNYLEFIKEEATALGKNKLQGLTIGSSMTGDVNNRFVGLISEIIIFNRILKQRERQDVVHYLSRKYSIKVGGMR